MTRVGRWSIGLLCLAVPALALAQTPRDLIHQGNQHYAAGRYAEALKCYDQAAAAGESAELLHDRAAAHFKLGQVDAARDLWVRLKEARDPLVEARTRYNLGNCDYADALAAGPQDAQQALKLLAEAVDQYREALRIDPALDDARANLELSQVLKRQIEEQAKQQQQDSKDQSKDKQKQDQQKQDQQKQDQQQSSSQPSESEDQQQDSQSKDQKPQPTSKPTETQPSKPQSQPSQDDQSQDEDQDQEQQKQPQTGDQEQPQSQPAAEPKPAQTQPADEDQQQNPPVPIEMTRQQAERLLQMIRDAEKARREMLARQRMSRQKPVERDW